MSTKKESKNITTIITMSIEEWKCSTNHHTDVNKYFQYPSGGRRGTLSFRPPFDTTPPFRGIKILFLCSNNCSFYSNVRICQTATQCKQARRDVPSYQENLLFLDSNLDSNFSVNQKQSALSPHVSSQAPTPLLPCPCSIPFTPSRLLSFSSPAFLGFAPSAPLFPVDH